ncbi:MAG: hypothetical protein VX585_04845, partial [Pseudomonadota bacterium]|nr:hypothetical protein [Pseudomonadota bacterium]
VKFHKRASQQKPIKYVNIMGIIPQLTFLTCSHRLSTEVCERKYRKRNTPKARYMIFKFFKYIKPAYSK